MKKAYHANYIIKATIFETTEVEAKTPDEAEQLVKAEMDRWFVGKIDCGHYEIEMTEIIVDDNPDDPSECTKCGHLSSINPCPKCKHNICK